MLKKIITSLAFIIFSIESAYALDVILGAKASYCFWTPYIKDYGEAFPATGWQYVEGSSGIMAGPGISLLLADNIDLSMFYLYGEFNSPYKASYYDSAESEKYYDYSGSMKTIRHDLDCSLNLQIIYTLNIFAGFKYQPLQISLKSNGTVWDYAGTPVGTGILVKSKYKFEQKNYIPEFGAGYRFIFNDRLAFNLNVSGLYLQSETTITRHTESYEAAVAENINESDYSVEMTASGRGINTEPGFIITISGNFHIFIGYRFQYIRITGKTRDEHSEEEVADMCDVLHGCSIAMLYRIL